MEHVACRMQSGERQGKRVNLLGQSREFFAGDFDHFSLPLRHIGRGGLPAIFLHPHTTSVPWRCVRFLVYSEQVFFCVVFATRGEGWSVLDTLAGVLARVYRACPMWSLIHSLPSHPLSPLSSLAFSFSSSCQKHGSTCNCQRNTHTHTPAERTRARHSCAVHSACSQGHSCAMGYPILAYYNHLPIYI